MDEPTRRAWLAAELERLRPTDPRGAESLAAARVALPRLARPFDRHADPTHFTGSAIVVGARGVVLLLHKRLGIWVQPGGHVDPGEAPWDAAARETTEETGLAVRPVGDPCRCLQLDAHPAGDHVHLDLRFLLEADDLDPQPPPGESPDVHWFDWGEAAAVADSGLAAGLAAARTLYEGARRPAR